MEQIFSFSESALRVLPSSGRAAIENEVFCQSSYSKLTRLQSICSSDAADFLHFRISIKSASYYSLLQLLHRTLSTTRARYQQYIVTEFIRE